MKDNELTGARLFDISRYDNEVQAIMTRPPNWLTRWGLLLMSIAVFTIIGTTYFFRYPDIVKTGIVLNSVSAPVKVIANQNGYIKLLVKDGDSVRKKQVLGYIAGTTRFDEIVKYMAYSDTLRSFIQAGSFKDIYANTSINIGDLQDSYISLMNHIGNYMAHSKENRVGKTMKRLELEKKIYNKIGEKIENQAQLYKEQHELARKRFERDSILYLQKVLSRQEYENSKNSFLLPSASSIEASAQSLKGNEIRVSEVNSKEIELVMQEERYENELKNNVILAFNELQKRIDLWRQQFVMEAPIDGKVTLFDIRNSDDYIFAGKEIFNVTQPKSHVEGICTLPIQNSSKVKTGQDVNIEFLNYPANEYGFIRGKVKTISPVPKDGNYFLVVELPDDPVTDQKLKIEYKDLMAGTANIKTEDMRLMERLFYRFKKTIQR